MELKDKEAWDKGAAINTDPYGKATVDYARAWAELMEERMADGTPLEEIAKQASHDADTYGITGFMYGAAASMLARMWKHGERFRRWHNLEVQCKDEGEKANASGGILNPAIITLELPEDWNGSNDRCRHDGRRDR